MNDETIKEPIVDNDKTDDTIPNGELKNKIDTDNRKSQKLKEEKNINDGFEEEIIEIRRVTRVTAGGRRLRFSALVVVGDKKGKLGFALRTANEVSSAISKASIAARKRLIAVPIVKQTIPHEIKVKFNSAKIHLMPAKDGTGIIAGGSIRRVLELAGISNIYSKMHGSKNKINNVKAIFDAFNKLRENVNYKNIKTDIDVDLKSKKSVFTS